jgi:PAS domain S-box-containing protein
MTDSHTPPFPSNGKPGGESDNSSTLRARYDPAAGVVARAPGGIAHEAGALHALLVDTVQDYAIFALDPHGYILSWNPGADRLKGYTREEIIGKHFSVFYPPEKVAEHFPEYELEVAARVGRFEDEDWRIRKDGSRFWASVIITALRSADGELIGFGKVTRDLTERRQAEEALRESEERFRLLVQGARDYAIFMLDPSGHIATWNEGAQRINGYTADEIIGQHFSIFYPPEDIAAGKPPRELDIASKVGKYEEEGWRVRKDGTLFWASVVITALRNEGGRLVGFGKVTRDLTQRRAAEEDARRVAAEQAARRAAESRERELKRLAEQHRQQAAELEVANRAKGQFLAAMSHELRTPLNAIGGYAELIELGLRGPVTDAQRQDLARIRRSQQYLLGIINDILNFSRIEAGQLTYDIGPVRVHEVVNSVMHMVAPQARAKGLVFERMSCAPDAVAWADRAKVEQIVLNLVSNAVKFTARGGTVSIDCSDSPGGVTITVRDTGTGIAADQLEAIFEPFVQVGRTLTSPGEGSGLGLAISRDLARAMRGEITVESTLGVGSIFTVTLPRADGGDPA